MAETEVHKRFLREPLSNTPLMPGVVPGVGPVNVEHLEKRNVRSSEELMGFFMLHNRQEEAFSAWLAECKILPKYAAQITEALVKKSAEFCTEDPPSYPKSPPRGADGTTSTVMESFTRSPLSTATIVPGQVPGLGEVGVKKVSTTVRKKLASASSKTPSSVQLLGLFLTLGRDETAFEKFLTDECGCRQQDASRTVEALQAKAKLICDMHTSAATATPAGKRTGTRLESTPEVGAAPGMPTEAEDETNVKAQVESTRSSLGLLLLLGLLVAVAAVVAKVGGYV